MWDLHSTSQNVLHIPVLTMEQNNIHPVLDPEYAYILIRNITLRMRMKNTEQLSC